MPDFPSELVEAIRDGKWTIEQEIATTIAHADGQTPIPDLAALIAARVVPLIQQAERDRLAKQAGTNPYIDGDGIPTWAAWEAWDEGAACGVAAERERVREAITRLADTYAPNGTFLPTASILSLLSSPAEPTPHADNANAAIREARNLPPSEKGAMANRCDHGITLRQHRGVEETCVECGAKIRADVAAGAATVPRRT